MPAIFRNFWVQWALTLTMVAFTFLDPEQLYLPPWSKLNHWWPVLTGHLVHSNTHHLAMNLCGFWLLSLSFDRPHPTQLLLIIIIVSLGISACLLMFDHVNYYGFSGVLHGLLAYVLVKYFVTQRWLHAFMLILLFGKVGGEYYGFIDNSASAELIGMSIAVQSHLYGTGLGLVCGIWLQHKPQESRNNLKE